MNEPKKRSLTLNIFGQGVIELLFYLPVFITIAVYLLPTAAVWPWIATIPFCYWASSVILGNYSRLRYGVKLLLAIAIGALHSGLFFVAWVGDTAIIPMVICGLIAAFAAMRGMSSQLRGWSFSFPNTQMLIGVILYVAVQPLKVIVLKRLTEYNGILIVCGIAAVILFFFFANERHLNSETVDSGKTSATLAFKRQNRILIVVIVSIISILALFRQIQQMIERFFHSIIERMMNWFNQSRQQAPLDEPPIDSSTPQMPMEESKPPSDWMLLLEQIAKIFAIVLVIIIFCILFYFIVRKLMQWAKLLAAKLQERGADSRNGGVGFTDEVESLMTLTNLREQMSNKLKKLLPKKRSFAQEWNELRTNTEKIRFLYTRLLKSSAEQGYMVKEHMTPRETSEDLSKWQDGKLKIEGMPRFIEVYEEARYGDKQPDDQQINAFKNQ
ncbi:DUF4129 domain-containing protein [Bacillus sp. FJAT-28004]|uniref:DUF4129 domain-containing protein n=1 Tax=Bacillus sp. FJAT-28004 TaxID=1679165 RepID=UPI0006B54603|nr:DUF4129 domain-containing protein [Bacillus sp. FJAT-28004]